MFIQSQHTALKWWKKKPGAFSVIQVFFSGIPRHQFKQMPCDAKKVKNPGPGPCPFSTWLVFGVTTPLNDPECSGKPVLAARIPSNDAHFCQNILCCSKVRDVNRSNPLWSFYSDPTGTWLVWDAWTFEVTDSSAENTYRKKTSFCGSVFGFWTWKYLWK